MKVTHFKKVSETSGVCIYNRIIYTVRSLYETFK